MLDSSPEAADRSLAIVNWDEYQHYSDRNPPWIKLYNRMLDNPELMGLPAETRWLAVGLMLLASRYANKIPYDPDWIRWRLRLQEDPDLQSLQDIGFIRMLQDASTTLADSEQDGTLRLQDAPAGEGEGENIKKEGEGEGEAEREREKEQHTLPDERATGFPKPSDLERNGQQYEYPEPFEKVWAVYPPRHPTDEKKGAYRKWRATIRNGAEPGDLLEAVLEYRAYCDAQSLTGTRKVKMCKTFFGPDEPWRENWGGDGLSEADRKAIEKRKRMEKWDLSGARGDP